MPSPTSPEEFAQWSTSETCGVFTPNTQPWYWSGQNNLMTVLQDSPFLSDLGESLISARTSFRAATDSELFVLGKVPQLDHLRRNLKFSTSQRYSELSALGRFAYRRFNVASSGSLAKLSNYSKACIEASLSEASGSGALR